MFFTKSNIGYYMLKIAPKMKEDKDFKWNSLFFAFLVCAFHKEPVEVTDFDLKNYLEFIQAVKNFW